MKSQLLNFTSGEQRVVWRCPGCDCMHSVVTKNAPGGTLPVWTWNGNECAPTFNPSVLVTSGHYTQGASGKCWCEWKDGPAPFKCVRCHCFVRDGNIEFLADCTHSLAGKAVEIPDSI